ncbi:MAG TPA: hypothetical protein VGN72_23810 [Tepidisphaeraceae bacterium]|jgi:hypothetical protein|nr:hypothetical protein [Tepidisphaeraceae bacterium]
MIETSDLPVATLAYQTNRADEGWQATAKMVGRLGFWYGVFRLVQFSLEVSGGVLIGRGNWWRAVSQTGTFSVLLFQVVPACLYLLAILAGCTLAIIAGRRLAGGHTAAAKLLFWGMVLIGAAGIFYAALNMYSIVSSGAYAAIGYTPYYLLQVSVGTLSSLLLPAFIAYFVSRPQVRTIE